MYQQQQRCWEGGGDLITHQTYLSSFLIPGINFKRPGGAAEHPQCSDCCPCRRAPQVLEPLPSLPRLETFPCGQHWRASAIRGLCKVSPPCAAARGVVLSRAGYASGIGFKSEAVPPLPGQLCSPAAPLGWQLLGSSQRWERGADSPARTPGCTPSLPTRGARGTQSPLEHKPRLLREPGGTRDPRAPPAVLTQPCSAPFQFRFPGKAPCSETLS